MDSRMIRATTLQHRQRQRSLSRGARRIGWKVGAGHREHIDGLSVGFLTSETALLAGATYPPGLREMTYADAEVAVLIGANRFVDGYACALELCDLGGDIGPEVVIAQNLSHRAFLVGPLGGGTPTTGRLVVNGQVRAEAPVPTDLDDRLSRVRDVLSAVGEELQPGDLVLTGAIVQERVVPGDHVRSEVDGLGTVGLVIGAAG